MSDKYVLPEDLEGDRPEKIVVELEPEDYLHIPKDELPTILDVVEMHFLPRYLFLLLAILWLGIPFLLPIYFNWFYLAIFIILPVVFYFTSKEQIPLFIEDFKKVKTIQRERAEYEEALSEAEEEDD